MCLINFFKHTFTKKKKKNLRTFILDENFLIVELLIKLLSPNFIFFFKIKIIKYTFIYNFFDK